MKGNVLTISIGLLLGLIIGGATTWHFTSNLINNAVVEAELKFNELLEIEQAKYNIKVDKLETVKNNLNDILSISEHTIDSLNTTIFIRSNELNKIKRKYDKQISSIDGMSHNELADFFSERYRN